METGSLVEISSYSGSDFRRLVEYDGWSVAFLRYSERFASKCVLERHSQTDEVFVLLEGEAVLYVKDAEIAEIPMEKNKVYNIKRGVWHHITVSPDATVMVVENRNTSKENTERVAWDADI